MQNETYERIEQMRYRNELEKIRMAKTSGYYVVQIIEDYKNFPIIEVEKDILAYADQSDIENPDINDIFCSVYCGVQATITFNIPRKHLKVLDFRAT